MISKNSLTLPCKDVFKMYTKAKHLVENNQENGNINLQQEKLLASLIWTAIKYNHFLFNVLLQYFSKKSLSNKNIKDMNLFLKNLTEVMDNLQQETHLDVFFQASMRIEEIKNEIDKINVELPLEVEVFILGLKSKIENLIPKEESKKLSYLIIINILETKYANMIFDGAADAEWKKFLKHWKMIEKSDSLDKTAEFIATI